MKSFKEWKAKIEEQSLDIPQAGQQAWKASKDEIIEHWQKLPPGVPMTKLRSVPPDHHGPTYSFDGLRITGSGQWIDFVLSRIKEVLNYETAKGGQTRLQVIYKQIVDNKTQQPVPESFVFYIQAHERENADAGPEPIEPQKVGKMPKIKPFKKLI